MPSSCLGSRKSLGDVSICKDPKILLLHVTQTAVMNWSHPYICLGFTDKTSLHLSPLRSLSRCSQSTYNMNHNSPKFSTEYGSHGNLHKQIWREEEVEVPHTFYTVVSSLMIRALEQEVGCLGSRPSLTREGLSPIFATSWGTVLIIRVWARLGGSTLHPSCWSSVTLQKGIKKS